MRRILPIAALILTPSPLLAQTPGAHFELRTATGQTTFHIGERIPLILSFTGPENTYDIVLYNFGRTDPLQLDSFAITPATGWSDSLATYAALAGGGCCGAIQQAKLAPQPALIPVDLNEWARFDEPGTYTVSITSHRVMIPHVTTLDHRTDLASNPLQIHIIAATPAWQTATLARALKALAIPHKPYAEESPERTASTADLRYLDSPPAIAALADDLLGDDYNIANNAMLGLIGLPRKLRDLGLAAMNKLIDDPNFPISPEFLQTIAWLQIDDVPVPTLKTPEQYQKFSAAHQAAMQPFLDAAWQTTASELPRKTGLASSVTAKTLVATQTAHPSPETLKLIGAVLRESFPTLSDTDKRDLLADQWETISSLSLLPQLRAIATAPARDYEHEEIMFGKSLRVVALARWYGLEPEAASAEIFRLIGTKSPYLSADDLDFLPAQTFPQFEDLWAERFAEDEDSPIAASLLIRFGTGAAASRITPLLTQPSSNIGCHRLYEALAYLVKFDPQSARRFLNRPPAKPRADQPDCSVRQLDSIGTYVQDPILTEAALTAIKNTNDDIVADALAYLRKFDDDSAQAPILARYLQWSEHQSPKPAPPNEYDLLNDRDNPAYAQLRQAQDDRQLGNEFARTLLANQAWIPDADLISAVTDHCVSPEVCAAAKDLAKPNLNVYVTPPREQYDLHIGAFDPATLDLLEAKLDQFPKGTVFTFGHTSTGNDAAQNKFEATMPAIFTKHGMTLGPPTP